MRLHRRQVHPRNHAATGDRLLDSICTGATIPHRPPGELLDEARQLYGDGLPLLPLSRAQPADPGTDHRQRHLPGGQPRPAEPLPRPDAELRRQPATAARCGEHPPLRTVGAGQPLAIPLHLGGAHFVTIQAAIELQVICELEKQGASSTSTMPPARPSSPTCATTSRRRRWKRPSCRPTPPARAPTTG
ncbi:hypothetical protein ACPA9J_09970 [Pseudomonas aeruginosa]